MAGTMGRLAIGVTGLQTSQYALNTTAHNLTNTQTEGYTRQQVLLTDMAYNRVSTASYYTNTVGLGVVTAQIRQVRDQFADETYRRESGRMSYYKAQYETVSEIENYFGELEGKDFNTTLNDFWTSLQELQKETNSIVTRSSFISNALTFVDRVQTVRSSLIEYQRNLNTEIKDQVKTINDLADTILDLNQQILAVETADIENANDLKDKRNQALDQLSKLVNTETVANTNGTVEVYVEGRCLVTLGRTYKITTQKVCENEQYQKNYNFTGSATDFLMPIWQEDESAVFNIDRVPTADSGDDIGSLHGLLMSRGYFISNYTDVPTKPTKPLEKDFANPADYQTAMADYENNLNKYTKDLEYFNTYVEPYTVTNLEAQFDVMVHAIVTQMNDTLCPNKTVTLADGSTVKVLDTDAAGIGMGQGNEYPGTELFVRNSQPRYTEKTLTLADGTTETFQVYNEEDPKDFYSLYTIGNLKVNEELLQNPSLLPLSRVSGEEAQTVADALLDKWNQKFATVSPNSLVECNYKDYYAGMMDDLSDRGYTYDAMAKTGEQAVTDAGNARQQLLGVSSDEELSSMIRFQHAYNASSRYINTVSEMIAYLIEKLGA